MNKKYYNISDVAKMLGIKEYVIRYWDSIDPRTNLQRINGISTKSKGGTRYFNSDNIQKLEKLKKILYDGENQNYSLKLANKMLNSRSKNIFTNDISYNLSKDAEKTKKAIEILSKMRKLLKKDLNNL